MLCKYVTNRYVNIVQIVQSVAVIGIQLNMLQVIQKKSIVILSCFYQNQGYCCCVFVMFEGTKWGCWHVGTALFIPQMFWGWFMNWKWYHILDTTLYILFRTLHDLLKEQINDRANIIYICSFRLVSSASTKYKWHDHQSISHNKYGNR